MKGFALFLLGVLIGYTLIQGAQLIQQNYLWTIFYQG